MPFQAVAAQRLYEQVAKQISTLIAAGEFSVGDRLPPERDLARKLAVSRPVLREAMVALEIAGWVDVRTGAGSFVKRASLIPPGFVDAGPGAFELLAARRMIESQVAALAAEKATRADIAAMRALNDEIRREITSGRKGVEPDQAFHRRLAESTGNSVMTDIVAHLWSGMNGPILARFHEMTDLPGKHRSNIADHEAIIAAIERADPNASRQAMVDHIRHVEQAFMEDEEADAAPVR